MPPYVAVGATTFPFAMVVFLEVTERGLGAGKIRSDLNKCNSSLVELSGCPYVSDR